MSEDISFGEIFEQEPGEKDGGEVDKLESESNTPPPHYQEGSALWNTSEGKRPVTVVEYLGKGDNGRLM